MKCASEKWREVFVLNELTFEALDGSRRSDSEIPIIIAKNVLKYPEQVGEFLENGDWWNNGDVEGTTRPG